MFYVEIDPFCAEIHSAVELPPSHIQDVCCTRITKALYWLLLCGID